MVTTILHIPSSYQFRSNPGSDPDCYLGSGSVVMTRFQYELEVFNIIDLIRIDVTKQNGGVSVGTFIHFVWVTIGEKILSQHISAK